MSRGRLLAIGLAIAVVGGCASATTPSSAPATDSTGPSASPAVGGGSATPPPTPAPSASPKAEAGPIAGTWRVRKILAIADRGGLVPGPAFDDEAYLITADCPTEPCPGITVVTTPLGHASPATETTFQRDGDRYVSAAAAQQDGPCVADDGSHVPGGATVSSTTRLWIATVRPSGTAVESTLLFGEIEVALTPTPIGEAAGCARQTATYDLNGRRGAVAVLDDDELGRPPTGAALVDLPRLDIKVSGATIDYFAVRGDTVKELAVSVARGGIKACGEINYEWFEGDARPSACIVTSFGDIEDALTTRGSGGACRITDANVEARFTLHFPRWTEPDEVPGRLLAWWRDIVEFIRDHEAGHVRIGRDHVERLNDRLDGADCADADAIIRRWARQHSDAQEAFDRAEYDRPWPVPPRGY